MTLLCQRWREHRESYRPAGEPIDPSRYGVEIVEKTDAKRFVVAHHYQGNYPAQRLAVGLFRSRAWITSELVGVAVFSVPGSEAVLPCWFPDVADDAAELGRFVLLDEVPANGETWFLARALRAVKRELRLRAILSFSDPMQRVSILDGHVVTPGHIGTIYQAHNAAYMGRGTARTEILLPSGEVFSEQDRCKIRGDKRGAAAAYRRLMAWGAPARQPFEDGKAYLARALADTSIFRRVRHPGRLAYGWRLDGAKLASAPYPKGEVLVRAA